MVYFESIHIKWYKWFEDSWIISFNIPDWVTPGSGLNIFVGENWSGKTTILKAINLLWMSTSSIHNKISTWDFHDIDNEIEIIWKIQNAELLFDMPAPRKKTMNIKEIKSTIKSRNKKSPWKLLSPQFSISTLLEPTTRSPERYKDKGLIPDFYLSYDPDRMKEALNIFYFDETRINQSKKWYYTTFSRVMEDFNRKFLKENNDTKKNISEAWNNYREKIIIENKDIDLGFIKKFDNEDMSNIALDFLKLEEPYLDAFFCVQEDWLKQIPLSDLWSWINLVFSILFLKEIANKSKWTIIFCIDEPELSLHPQREKKVFEILKEESKTKQIFIATHSLHFIDSNNLSLVKKFDKIGGAIKINWFSDEQANRFKSLFYLENREIFFSKKIILVEWISDKDRINQLRLRLFIQKQEIDFFVMFGLNNFKQAKEICETLGIEFTTIVDLDFIWRYPDFLPNLTSEELNNINELKIVDKLIAEIEDEKTIKILDDLRNKIVDKNKCISSKIVAKMETDDEYKTMVEIKIDELKKKNKINVLSRWMIEDYLDDEWNIVNDANWKKLKELKDILWI